MPVIKIMSDKIDAAKPKSVPNSPDLVAKVPRQRGGSKHSLGLTESYNKQGGSNENKEKTRVGGKGYFE